MSETVVDRVFGKLVWDGFHHEGWAGTFVDEEFLSWGAAYRAQLPADEEGEADQPGGEADSIPFVPRLLSEPDSESDEQTRRTVGIMRDFVRRVEAYDGSLDADRLRKAGRLKVVVRNPRDRPPTEAQQAAWRAFRRGGKRMAERIAAALLDVYRKQRPERVRWWKAVYGDSHRKTLPVVKTTQAIREIVQVDEFRVYAEQNGVPTVAVVLSSFWSDKDIRVSVRGGKVVEVGPVEHADGIAAPEDHEEIESPAFGRLRRRPNKGAWSGVFHSDHLRGWDEASKRRYRFKKDRETYVSSPWRSWPSWDTVSGDFDLHVVADKGGLPSSAQEAAFAAFNAAPKTTARGVLSAILAWYRAIRPEWVKGRNGPRQEIASILPDVRTPDGLLEIIQLQSVVVMQEPPVEETTGPRVMTNPFTGKKEKLPPKKPGVAIILHFHWEDEHGLGVRWRSGEVEAVGDWESALNE